MVRCDACAYVCFVTEQIDRASRSGTNEQGRFKCKSSFPGRVSAKKLKGSRMRLGGRLVRGQPSAFVACCAAEAESRPTLCRGMEVEDEVRTRTEGLTA